MSKEQREIKYVEIEAFAKNDKAEGLVKGLFFGIYRDQDTVYTRIYLNKSTHVYLSPRFYDIVDIAIVYGDNTREEVFYHCTAEDQKLAQFELAKILMELRTLKMCNDVGEVSIGFYKGVPAQYRLTEESVKSKVLSSSQAKNLALVTSTVDKTKTTTKTEVQKPNKTVVPKKEHPVMFVKRRAKLPTAETLKALKKKVALISDNEYDSVLPEIKEKKQLATDFAKKGVVETVADNFIDQFGNDDDDFDHNGMHQRHWM